MTDFKKLKKIADICRKAGIKQFKCPEFEFTLSDNDHITSAKEKSSKSDFNASNSHSNSLIQTDTLTEDQLLFWSANTELSSGEGAN